VIWLFERRNGGKGSWCFAFVSGKCFDPTSENKSEVLRLLTLRLFHKPSNSSGVFWACESSVVLNSMWIDEFNGGFCGLVAKLVRLGFGFKDEVLLPLFQLDSLLRFSLWFSPSLLKLSVIAWFVTSVADSCLNCRDLGFDDDDFRRKTLRTTSNSLSLLNVVAIVREFCWFWKLGFNEEDEDSSSFLKDFVSWFC